MRCSTRRSFLRTSLGGLLASTLHPLFGQESGKARAKNCIVLWMAGGPSHVDTWDLKAGNGPIKPINTAVAGFQISEHLPLVAKQAKALAVVRSVTSVEADHERATYYLHTGNRPEASVTFPTLGAIASKEWPASADLPMFVSMGEPYSDSGFLGREHAPFVVSPYKTTASLQVPERFLTRMDARKLLLDQINQDFAKRTDSKAVAEDERVQKRALGMMSSKAVHAFDIDKEDAKVKAAYGSHLFGRGCLLARRLIENGVRFVEIMLDDWDAHVNNFTRVSKLSAALDPAMASLLRELEERKLLDETLIVWMGEFGRTPVINKMNGRDHHSKAFSVVLAGGGVGGGRIIGKTDASGTEVTERPVTIPDLYASIFHAFGFDPTKEYMAPGDRPVKLIDKGAVVKELFA